MPKPTATMNFAPEELAGEFEAYQKSVARRKSKWISHKFVYADFRD
jgi:hypothetical protein